MTRSRHSNLAKLTVLSGALGMVANGAPAQTGSGTPQPGQIRSTPSQQPRLLQLPDTISAPPFTIADKFNYRVIQTFGLRGFLGSGVSAALGQGAGSPREWGGGVEGFAKRYASGLAGNLTRQTMAFGLEAALHEDPRYFPSDEKPVRLRVLNALKQVFVCRTDSGHSSFAYGRVISSFANGQLVNAWQPASIGSVGDGLNRGGYTLGGDFAYNLAQEFFPFLRPHSIRRHQP